MLVSSSYDLWDKLATTLPVEVCLLNMLRDSVMERTVISKASGKKILYLDHLHSGCGRCFLHTGERDPAVPDEKAQQQRRWESRLYGIVLHCDVIR